MKKVIILLAMAMLTVGLLTACKKNNTTNNSATPTGTTEKKDLYHPVGGEMTLGNYKGLEYTEKKIEVTEEDIQNQIKLLLGQYPNYKKIESPDHTDVKEGDVVNIDYVGKIAGVAFDGGTNQGDNLKIGSHSFIDGFESSLVGKTIGTTVDINVTFPNPYTPNTALSGADAVFTVTLNYFVAASEDIDDAYVAKYASQYASTVEGLKKYINDLLLEDKKADAEDEMWDSLIKQVIEGSTYTSILPEDVDYYYNLSLETLHQYATLYNMTEEALYNKYYDTSEMDYNAFLAKCREQAEENVKEFMALQAIVKAENLTITDAKYQEVAEEYRQGVGAESIAALEESYGKKYIEYCILNDMALDLIYDNAKITKAE